MRHLGFALIVTMLASTAAGQRDVSIATAHDSEGENHNASAAGSASKRIRSGQVDIHDGSSHRRTSYPS